MDLYVFMFMFMEVDKGVTRTLEFRCHWFMNACIFIVAALISVSL